MSENTLWIVLTAVGVAGCAVLGFGLKKLQDGIRAVDAHFQSPQLSFRYRAKDVQDMLRRLDGGAKLFDRFCWMMLFMMAEVLIVLMAASHNITDILWLQKAMFALSGLIWLSGSAETLLVARRPAGASVLSLIKWGAFALWTLGMFAGLFIKSTVY